MIAIGSPLTKALGMAGSVGSHSPVAHLPAAGACAPGARSQLLAGPAGVAAAAGRAAGCPAAGHRPGASLVEFGLRCGAFGRQLVQLGLLGAEGLLSIGQCRHRSLLTRFRVDDGLIRVLLGQPCGRLLVHLFGAGPLQIADHLLRADRQHLTGCGGVEDVAGVGRGQV